MLSGICFGALIVASLAARVQICLPAPKKSERASSNLRKAIESAAPSRKRVLGADVVAHRVVCEIRAEALNFFPLIPSDLDDYIVRWCEAAGAEPVCADTVREIIAGMPHVVRARPRLNLRRPDHRYVRQRQIVRNDINDRPTLYIISDLPDVSSDGHDGRTVRPERSDRPTTGRTDRTGVRTRVGQAADTPKRPAIAPLIELEAA